MSYAIDGVLASILGKITHAKNAVLKKDNLFRLFHNPFDTKRLPKYNMQIPLIPYS